MTSPGDQRRGPVPLSQGAVLVGKYRIERVLGEGGMGVVYAAHHLLLDRPVALKLLARDAAMQPEALARFLNEARNAARVDNEYVCRVMDLGVLTEGQPYIAMELLSGVDLGRLLAERGPLPVVEAVGYVIQALTGIGMAHLMGVVHRDLKPSNLFLANRADGGRLVKVLDFGISKSIGATGAPVKQNLTAISNTIGSPAYMSPEQVNLAANIDARADIWAVGVILYQLITGELPFASPNVAEVLAFILEKDPVPPSARRADVSPGLEAVLARCLAKDVEHRFPSAAELARALGPYGPWSGGGAAGARADAAPEARGTDRGPALTAPGVWTQKAGAESHANGARRSPYLRMMGIGAAIGALLLAVLVVAASRNTGSRDATAAPAVPAVAVVPPVGATVKPAATATPTVSVTASAAAAPPIASAVASTEPTPAEPAVAEDPLTASAASAAPSALHPGQLRRPGLSRQRR